MPARKSPSKKLEGGPLGIDKWRERADRTLQEAQRGLNGTEGARMRYLAARVEHSEAERDALGVLLGDSVSALGASFEACAYRL
jgi:hypothetical protein